MIDARARAIDARVRMIDGRRALRQVHNMSARLLLVSVTGAPYNDYIDPHVRPPPAPRRTAPPCRTAARETLSVLSLTRGVPEYLSLGA